MFHERQAGGKGAARSPPAERLALQYTPRAFSLFKRTSLLLFFFFVLTQTGKAEGKGFTEQTHPLP